MFATTLKKLLGRAVLALGLALGSNAALADVILNVSVNTTGFGGSGYLDFGYSGPGMGEPVSTATMTGLSGFDLSKFALEGAVVAQGGGFLFTNTPGLNSALYEAAFDSVYSFTLVFAGDAIDAVSSTFSIQAFKSDFTPAGSLLDPTLLTLDWSLLPSGVAGVTPTVFDGSVSAVPAAAVPEPSSLLMAALGLALLGFVRRQRG